MSYTTEYKMKKGLVLITADGYLGDEDSYLIQDVIKEVLHPDSITYGVDSLGATGSFVKDGITVRMSSESPFDACCFDYKENDLTDEQKATLSSWLELVMEKVHEKKAPVDHSDDDEW